MSKPNVAFRIAVDRRAVRLAAGHLNRTEWIQAVGRFRSPAGRNLDGRVPRPSWRTTVRRIRDAS